MRSKRVVCCSILVGLLSIAQAAPGQQGTVGTPFNTANDSFYEQKGTSWGFNWKGMNASFGRPNNAAPQFGGFDPSAGLSGGLGFRGGGFNGSLNFGWQHGYRQSLTSQTPSVTMMNGQSAFISDTSQSPFVIGHIPVVGGFPTMTTFSPVMPPHYSVGNHRLEEIRRRIVNREAARGGNNLPQPPKVDDPRKRIVVKPKGQPMALINPRNQPVAKPQPPVAAQAPRPAAAGPSSATRAVPSVAEARRLHKLEQSSGGDDARVYFERGRTAEESGRTGAARVYYKMAARRASGDLKQQVEARLRALDSPGR